VLQTTDFAAADIDRNGIRRLHVAGLIHPVHRGIWSVVADLDLVSRIAAAAAAMGSGVGCLNSAALALGLDGSPADPRIHLSLPPTSTRRQVAGIARHWLELQPDDIVEVDGVAITRVERLILDAGRRWRREDVLSLSDSALRMRLIEPAHLAEIAVRLPTPAGRWLDLADGRSESPLETRTRLLLHDAGLMAMFEPQWTVRTGSVVIARIDFANPDRLLGLECDGKGPHGLPEALFRDRHRADDLGDVGWRLIRITWDDVVRAPAEVIRRIRRALDTA
jgi:very-short-patch-repair endonuclease